MLASTFMERLSVVGKRILVEAYASNCLDFLIVIGRYIISKELKDRIILSTLQHDTLSRNIVNNCNYSNVSEYIFLTTDTYFSKATVQKFTYVYQLIFIWVIF